MPDNVRMQKSIAMGDDLPTGNFGVDSLESISTAGSGPSPRQKKPLSDDKRAASSPVNHTDGRMPSQAEPDHGPHGY